MSLEQQLTDATAAQNRLTQTVANKMGQIDAKVASQKAAHDAWIESANSKFANNTAHAVFVGGNANKWYPVVFTMPTNVMGRIDVCRYTSYDSGSHGANNGSLRFIADVSSGLWGAMPSRVIPQSYQFKPGASHTTPFVADYAIDAYEHLFVLYLLGQRTYRVCTSWGDVPVVHEQDSGNLIYESSTPAYNVYRDAKSAVSTSIVPNNYLRGG